MLTCKEVTRLVSESLDRKLPLGRRIMVRLHLLMCSLCSRFRKQAFFLRDAARHFWKVGESAPGPGLSPEARDRIKQALKTGLS